MAKNYNLAHREIEIKVNNDVQRRVLLSIPDLCVYCNQYNSPKVLGAYGNNTEIFKIIFQCSRPKCNEIFIWHCKDNGLLDHDLEIVEEMKVFERNVIRISPSFVKLYGQSYYAKHLNLLEVCGAGFRKALEFLVKDYLIHLNPDIKSEIEDKSLGVCIRKIDNQNIMEIVDRTYWLGCDQTHYVKKWEGSNLDDLLALLDTTVNWISQDLTVRKLKKDMPYQGWREGENLKKT